ncbi:hypothetical protein FZC79_18920 [Rossellomorea vietnamensis]|uniref:Uncharacterized protein n=1 Tax=Rossellomorea vietnamensis TaxID=218284 RepID=A0A5D4K9E2_9BACI|nr:hypothetical protein [Rossellomorea vietnamensis]TYR73330.1 hypothetical protein FZC79_18920 [Rossellomorea vietnamensis]
MVKRGQGNRAKEQLQSVLRETNTPAILNDVIDTELGVMPGVTAEELTTAERYSVRNSTDGKTWNSADDR